MAEMTKGQIENMTMEDIRAYFRTATDYECEHKTITWEHGADIVNIVAIHGSSIADRLTN